MIHYIISFTVYTLAMSGLIALALFIYKKVTVGAISKDSKILSIEESMAIGPRKTLMIVKAEKERFLIASDIDKTTLIAKLNQNENLAGVLNNEKIEIPKTRTVDLSKIKTKVNTENVDKLYPNNDKKNIINQNMGNNLDTSDLSNKKIVHFEVITDKNPNSKGIRKSHPNNKRKNVTIEVGKIKSHGLSPIKEIVHKVNEL